MKTVLVTGGCGFIGSHTVLLLLQAHYGVVVVDNLSNSSEEALRRVVRLAGGRAPKFYNVDVRDYAALAKVRQCDGGACCWRMCVCVSVWFLWQCSCACIGCRHCTRPFALAFCVFCSLIRSFLVSA